MELYDSRVYDRMIISSNIMRVFGNVFVKIKVNDLLKKIRI